jgi:alanine-glyoxylate transaminase / serine-glyoxylate transaminase / serine-pyruvate transaminase
MTIHTGRHFLQIPGPTNVPDRVLRAMARPVMDHRGAEFAQVALEALDGMRTVFQTRGAVAMFPSSGTGGWEAAIVNTLSPGDRVLLFETGQFSFLWRQVAERLGMNVEYVVGDWRHGASAEELESRLRADRNHAFKAVMIVHNETSTGVTSRLPEIRRAMNSAGHPALLMVDAISSLAAIDYRHDEWQVDVTIASSQKGLMMPPGLSFNAISEKALAARASAKSARSYWDWEEVLTPSKKGFFPYTPAINLVFGLCEALRIVQEEGLSNVFRRHQRHGEAVRAAVHAWGLDCVCQEPRECSNTVTSVFLPAGYDADRLRALILEHFDMSLGAGLGKLAGKAFRIGHMGHFNDLMLAGTLCGVEMGMRLMGVPHKEGGVLAAVNAMAPAARIAEPV